MAAAGVVPPIIGGVAAFAVAKVPKPITLALGSPVALVSTSADGVPNAGVTSVGEVASTTEPVPVAVVEPVPPFKTGKAVPDKPMARVPLPVIGDPEILRNAGTVAATLVTVPDPAADAHAPSPRRNVLAEQVPLQSAITSALVAIDGTPVIVVFLRIPVVSPDNRVPLIPFTVVARLPAVFVISPVWAGSWAACRVPVSPVVGMPVKLVPVRVGAVL